MRIARGFRAIMLLINDDGDDDDIVGGQYQPSALAVYRGINCRLCSRTDDRTHRTMCDRVGIIPVITRSLVYLIQRSAEPQVYMARRSLMKRHRTVIYLSYHVLSCLVCLSVTLVYCDQTVG